jgi:hypothetical protein
MFNPLNGDATIHEPKNHGPTAVDPRRYAVRAAAWVINRFLRPHTRQYASRVLAGFHGGQRAVFSVADGGPMQVTVGAIQALMVEAAAHGSTSVQWAGGRAGVRWMGVVCMPALCLSGCLSVCVQMGIRLIVLGLYGSLVERRSLRAASIATIFELESSFVKRNPTGRVRRVDSIQAYFVAIVHELKRQGPTAVDPIGAAIHATARVINRFLRPHTWQYASRVLAGFHGGQRAVFSVADCGPMQVVCCAVGSSVGSSVAQALMVEAAAHHSTSVQWAGGRAGVRWMGVDGVCTASI